MPRKRPAYVNTLSRNSFLRHTAILSGVDKCITCGVEIHAIKTTTASVVMFETDVIDIASTDTGKPIMIITPKGNIARGYRTAKGKGYVTGYKPHPCISAAKEKKRAQNKPVEQGKLFQ